MECPSTASDVYKPQESGVQAQSSVDCQVEVMLVQTSQWLWHCRSERLPTSTRRPEEQYYNVEENIYIQIIRTVICEATDINPGNNQP
jgi:hypothetical protein